MQATTGSIFLDSGAHSFYIEHVVKRNDTEYKFFDTQPFWDYVDEYAEYIKENSDNITVYANVDVIRNPEKSFKVYKYLVDKHKLNPLPVVHVGTDLKWLKKYMDETDYVCIGGLGQGTSVEEYTPFADSVFNAVCNNKKRIPSHKLHGFAVTSPRLIHRYPWYSVDSTSWVQYGRFGAILIPKKKYGKYDYSKAPNVVFVSLRSPAQDEKGKHILSMSDYERDYVLEYIDKQGFVLGSSEIVTETQSYSSGITGKKETAKTGITENIIEKGVSNDNVMRDTFNAKFFIELAKSVPEWPWAFKRSKPTLI